MHIALWSSSIPRHSYLAWNETSRAALPLIKNEFECHMTDRARFSLAWSGYVAFFWWPVCSCRGSPR